MNLNLSLSILVGLFFSIFAVTLIKEDILITIHDVLKQVPKFVKTILFLVVVALLVFLIVFETMQLFK